MNSVFSPFAAITITLGLMVGGWFIGHGFEQARLGDRTVTVKGVSEREVTADVALWPIRYQATGTQLADAQTRIERSRTAVLAFLQKNGVAAAQVELQGLQVTDAHANPYRSGPVGETRFIITHDLMVRSDDPQKILEASRKVGDLVDAGVLLGSGEYGGSGPTYVFTKLNDLKPEMIADATAKAREGAQQFARDSKSRLGGIRSANQGLFVILPRDQAPGISEQSQVQKIVRVVSTVDYYLKD